MRLYAFPSYSTIRCIGRYEASVSPEGASDAIGAQPRYLLDAMRPAKRAIEVPLNTTYRLTIFIPFIRA
jgi:hypothetical protein